MQQKTEQPLTKETLHSLEISEKSTEDVIKSEGGYTFKDIVSRVRTGRLYVEIKSNNNGRKVALVKGGEKILFATQDEREIEILKLLKEGKNVNMEWTVKK